MNRTDKNSDQLDALLRHKMAESADVAEGARCPDPNALAAYYERALPAGENERLENHLADCARCQLMLAAIARADPGESVAPSANLSRWFTGWRIAAPALAAAVVVAVVVQEMRRREAGIERAQMVAMAKREARQEPPRTDAVAPSAQAPAAPAQATIGALAMNEPKPAPEAARAASGAGFAGDTQTRAKEKSAPSESGAEYPRAMSPKVFGGAAPSDAGSLAGSSRADVAVAPAAAPPTAATLSDQPAMGTSQSVAGAARGGYFSGGWGGRGPDAGYILVPSLTVPGMSWEVGSAGKISRSVGGSTYVAQNSGVTTDLLAGASPSGDICWVVGRAGTVLRTTDGGEHWAKLAAPVPDDLTSVSADSAAHAVVATADGRKFATTDAGATWQQQ